MGEQSFDEQNRAVYETAEAVAPGWERRRAFIEDVTAPAREWLVRELAPQPGDTVLELACGAGDTGFDAAAVVGANGRLISTDFSPSMVEASRRRGAERGVDNAEYRVVDAQRIDLDENTVDGVLCRFGFMLMPDPAAAMSETRRVLRPGGRAALTVWGPPDANPNFALLGVALVQAGHMPPADPEGPGIFALASEERLRGMLAAAGFGEVRTEEVAVRFRYSDIDEYMAVTNDTGGPIALVLAELSDDERNAIVDRIEEGFAPFAVDGGGYEVPGRTLCALAS
ncbi:MAG TPA: methyltransferase domain-containing protein [Solirubrobacterales bacterium]|nr:methyltransferase domain-containing protein [Solirubrobacterales bacterium]